MNAGGPQVVLISGAAGGIGSALVQAFDAAGWSVAAGWHRTRPAATGSGVFPVPLDVTEPGSVTAAVSAVLERWGRLDVWIHNAGNARDHVLPRMAVADWQSVVDVHLKGAFLGARAILPAMIRQGGGHIIHLASFSGRVGRAGAANYSAAKAALMGLTQSLARETGPDNIRVNAVSPGYLPTALLGPVTAADLARHAADNALGRINEFDEVARFVVHLAAMRNVSGQLFQLDSRIARG
ncbi:MAG: SDR family oxidoreductase [Verrucomicrobia bacterium]|nr:SDR family oxidoreductase [Verrucomicrobiota bacterium]